MPLDYLGKEITTIIFSTLFFSVKVTFNLQGEKMNALLGKKKTSIIFFLTTHNYLSVLVLFVRKS